MNPFPTKLYEETRCGEPQSLYPSHGVYSETRKQRNYLYTLSKRLDYDPPSQTCCHHQVASLVKALSQRTIESSTS